MKRAVCTCGESLGPPKNIVFRKQVNGKDLIQIVGRVSLTDAHRLYAEWIEGLTAPASPAHRENQLTIRGMCDAHLNRMRVNGKRYGDKAKLFYDRLVSFCETCGVTFALDLTSSLLTEFQTLLRQSGCSPAYCDRHLRMISAAWNTSLKHRPNPVKEVTLYRPDNTMVRFLSIEEEEAILKAALAYRHHSSSTGGNQGPRCAYEIILVALHTGMREHNVLQLHTDEVDFESRTIAVTQKNSLPLVVEMNQMVCDALLSICPKEPGHFFVNPRTGRPYTKFYATWEHLKRQAGITRPFRIHDLRHTFATNLGEITENPKYVMEALGHRNIETTMKYFHVRREKLREGIEALTRRRTDNRTESLDDGSNEA